MLAHDVTRETPMTKLTQAHPIARYLSFPAARDGDVDFKHVESFDTKTGKLVRYLAQSEPTQETLEYGSAFLLRFAGFEVSLEELVDFLDGFDAYRKSIPARDWGVRLSPLQGGQYRSVAPSAAVSRFLAMAEEARKADNLPPLFLTLRDDTKDQARLEYERVLKSATAYREHQDAPYVKSTLPILDGLKPDDRKRFLLFRVRLGLDFLLRTTEPVFADLVCQNHTPVAVPKFEPPCITFAPGGSWQGRKFGFSGKDKSWFSFDLLREIAYRILFAKEERKRIKKYFFGSDQLACALESAPEVTSEVAARWVRDRAVAEAHESYDWDLTQICEVDLEHQSRDKVIMDRTTGEIRFCTPRSEDPTQCWHSSLATVLPIGPGAAVVQTLPVIKTQRVLSALKEAVGLDAEVINTRYPNLHRVDTVVYLTSEVKPLDDIVKKFYLD